MESVATFVNITDLFEWHSLHPGLDRPEIGHPVRAANHISLRLSSLFQPIDLATPQNRFRFGLRRLQQRAA
jgi:hypothetical protein